MAETSACCSSRAWSVGPKPARAMAPARSGARTAPSRSTTVTDALGALPIFVGIVGTVGRVDPLTPAGAALAVRSAVVPLRVAALPALALARSALSVGLASASRSPAARAPLLPSLVVTWRRRSRAPALRNADGKPRWTAAGATRRARPLQALTDRDAGCGSFRAAAEAIRGTRRRLKRRRAADPWIIVAPLPPGPDADAVGE